ITSITGRVVLINGSAGLYFQVPPGYTSSGGHGTAVPLGDVKFGMQQLIVPTGKTNPSLQVANGAALLITHQGEQIALVFDGRGQPSGHGKPVYPLTGVVTSGTGRFDGVPGTYAATATAVGARVFLNFTVTLKYPTLV